MCFISIYFLNMKLNLKLLLTWLLLFAWRSFTLTQATSVEEFNTLWNNSTSCDDTIRGCIKNPKQSTWSFQTVEIKKLVSPTSISWIFQIDILIQWKNVKNNEKICSVVVFDQSESMGVLSGWHCALSGSDCIKWTKWNNAQSWAIIYSNTFINQNMNSKIWLVFFGSIAKIWRDLDDSQFWEDLFDAESPIFNWATNIHDWLIKAWQLLYWTDCKSKYIVLMTDWYATAYGTWWTYSQTQAPIYAINKAEELKSEWIIIYTVWYEIMSGAKSTLQAIATDENHYFDATESNIEEIFQNIWNIQDEKNAGKIINLEDEIWWAMEKIWNIEISSWTQIIESGNVYSFQVKIKNPNTTWFYPSNSWLTLTYIDATWDNQTLSINAKNSAEIYWDFIKCGWIYPNGANTLKTWLDIFEQYWSWNTLKPENKERKYTNSSTPWECEWTCGDNENYSWNTITNTCDSIVTVNFDLNGWSWTLPSINIISWMSIEEPSNKPTRLWYQFNWRKLNDEFFVFPWTITWNITLIAEREPNSYRIHFYWNWATSWNMENQQFTYDLTWTLNPNQYEREWYQFSWWNTKPDWADIDKRFSDEAEIKNLAYSWTFELFAQWKPNIYTIIFDWNWADEWTMTWLQVKYDQETKLRKNEYKKNWYKFLWWNTSMDGKWTGYTDEQLIKNLTTSWEVKLYAQWEKVWTSWWSSWGWWWWHKKDNCPDWDYSWDYYDWKCGEKPNSGQNKPEPTTQTGTTNQTEQNTTPTNSNKKCSIEGSTHSAEVNEAYIWACEKWIIKSNTIQGAKLWEFLNRAEMAKIVTIFEMIELDAKPNRNKDCSAFADSISWYNQEMKNYMITSCQLERMWIHTADYTPISDFMPKKFVSRAEFWTILSRILRWNKYEAEKNSRYYYVDHLNKLKNNWILTNIDPTLVERRSYAILMIYRAAKMMWKI